MHKAVMAKNPRQAGAEIGITPEMIEAGVAELRDSLDADPRFVGWDDRIVTKVWRAMDAARLGKAKKSRER
jgi:hypothetical protein